MPELPEVETIVRDLRTVCLGRTIEEADSIEAVLGTPRDRFAALLRGAAVLAVDRLGKWIVFRLSGGLTPGPKIMLVHLKMTGQFILGAAENPWPPQVRAAFRLSGLTDRLYYRDSRKFGRLRALTAEEAAAFLENLRLGPDPLKLNAAGFRRRLSGKKGRLKAVLLDQSVVSGLGNIYVDEGLFAAGLSPFRPVAGLTPEESSRLLKELKRLLKAAIAARGSTTDNYRGLHGGGSFQARHQVYGRAGRPCPKCGGLLARGTAGGRSTVWCPFCQPPGLRPEPPDTSHPASRGK